MWRSHREIAKPHFVRDELHAMVRIFNRHGDALMGQLEEAAAGGGAATLDVQKLFRRYTMDSFADAFFAVELRTLTQPSEFAQHFDFLQHAFSWRFRVGPLWRLRGLTPRMRGSIRYLHDYFRDLIAEARSDPTLPERTDLLAHYLRSRDEDGKEFTDEYLRDMLINFLLAGRDTTAALLTWLFYRLSDHPEVEKRLVEEILRVVGPDADPEPEQLSELRYMKQVNRRRRRETGGERSKGKGIGQGKGRGEGKGKGLGCGKEGARIRTQAERGRALPQDERVVADLSLTRLPLHSLLRAHTLALLRTDDHPPTHPAPLVCVRVFRS